MPRGEARSLRVRALRGEGGRVRGMSHAAWKCESHAPGTPRGTIPVPELPRESERGQRPARPPQFPDARRLHALPLQYSRIQLRCELPALSTVFHKYANVYLPLKPIRRHGIVVVRCAVMPRSSPFTITLSSAEEAELRRRAGKYTLSYFQVQRAKMILYAAEGMSNDEIAACLDTRREVVSLWRK